MGYVGYSQPSFQVHVTPMLMSAISHNAARVRPLPDVDLDLKEVARDVSAFRAPDNVRAAFELATTVVPLAFIWFFMWRTLDVHYAITLLLAVPAAGLLLRLFLIQHDCGHGAFFETRLGNDWLGRCIGVVTLSPYGYWRRTHAVHHASTGNLDRRGIGDVATLTVEEFASLGRWGRMQYRIYRSPLVLFGVGPAFVFLIQHRLPIGLMRSGWGPWISTMGTNAAIVLLWTSMAYLVGIGPFLLVQMPITLLAASLGVWLFYVQHQFEHTDWSANESWKFHQAALHGSSHYELPPVLRWFTANIGMHHLHHLCSAVPFYCLPSALTARPELAMLNRLTFNMSLRLVGLVLWDEATGRLISFREARTAGS